LFDFCACEPLPTQALINTWKWQKVTLCFKKKMKKNKIKAKIMTLKFDFQVIKNYKKF